MVCDFCGNQIEDEKAVQVGTFSFCSEKCKQELEDNQPDAFANPEQYFYDKSISVQENYGMY